MSVLRVNQIVNLTGDGPVEFGQGFSIPSGVELSTDINVSGIATATTFSGDGSQLDFGPTAVVSKVIAYTIVF